MKKILLPTNFSQKARNAAHYAIKFFQQEQAKFLLLNAYDLPFRPTEVRISALQGGLGVAAKKALIEDQHRFSKEISQYGSSIMAAAEFGRTSKVIIDHAKKHRVDLVVMGTDGGNYYKKLFSNSPTQEVLAKADCPIMAIPENARYQTPKRIVFIPDLEHPVNKEILAPLLNISEHFDSEIIVLNLLNNGNIKASEQQLAALKKILGKTFRSFHFLLEHRITEGLDNFLLDQEADLFVLQGRRSFLRNMFKSWLSQKSRSFSALPVLAIRN